MKKDKRIALIIVIIVIIGLLYIFISSKSVVAGEIPSYVTGETREMYEWSKTSEGIELLEQVPCYCGCKYSNHLHTRHCFWKDDGTFDKHGLTCSVCLDTALKTKEMHDQGKDICEIRKEIDKFYEPNAHLGTETPMPEGCGF